MHKIIGKQEKTVKNLGGKGFNLIKLDGLGLTPNFFAIGNSFFNEYLKKDSLLLEYFKNNISAQVNIKFIKKRILDFKFNKSFVVAINRALRQLKINRLIVRSSFVSEDSKDLSYAGLFDSYVCRKKGDIFLYIKKVWASQFNERVFSYQQKHNFKQGMAVIVQDFIEPNFSGVIFCQQNKHQEIFIEYCADTYQGVEAGTMSPFVALWRNGYLYLGSAESKAHSQWIYELIQKVFILTKKENIPLDIEFVVAKNNVYLLQSRPLTKTIEAKDIFFAFERYRRWKYHPSDFSVKEFKTILEELNINASLKINIKKDGVFIKGESYFSFIEEVKKKSQSIKFLNDFYKYYSEFILSQYAKTKNFFKQDSLLILSAKELNFKMSIIDFIHNLTLKAFKKFLMEKYNITESKNFEYFVPSISFTASNFLLCCKDKKKKSKYYEKKNFEHLKQRDLKNLINNIKAHQKKILNSVKRLEGKKKAHIILLKKLIWLRDMVDYHFYIITSFYGESISLILDKEKIRHSLENGMEICRFSMDEIKGIRENKICPDLSSSLGNKQCGVGRKSYAFPLKGVVASKGNFSGIVKVIKNFPDLKKITAKNILVSKYTHPYLITGMAVCRGIITEEGGMTSHAAIISRELGKPCLIGVEGCTNALTDDDKIKVFNGQIYKLK
ncbi:MAG: PEP/pyruvate-binding domain-containing protein [bacterium]|nr:PEP/pyruvate-binding domain-containing protein [bacterium]